MLASWPPASRRGVGFGPEGSLPRDSGLPVPHPRRNSRKRASGLNGLINRTASAPRRIAGMSGIAALEGPWSKFPPIEVHFLRQPYKSVNVAEAIASRIQQAPRIQPAMSTQDFGLRQRPLTARMDHAVPTAIPVCSAMRRQ